MKTFTRITVDPYQMGGRPCIRSLRIPVATIVGMVSEGMTETEILNAYPDLEIEDVREALRYPAEAVSERELPVALGNEHGDAGGNTVVTSDLDIRHQRRFIVETAPLIAAWIIGIMLEREEGQIGEAAVSFQIVDKAVGP